MAGPAFADGLLYFDSGHSGSGVAVDTAGQGNVSATRTRWKGPSIPESLSSPIIVDKRLYRLTGAGYLCCWNLADGKEIYKQKLEGLTSTWASPIADPQGRIFLASAGKSLVVQAGPEFKLLSANDLGDPNHASPAVSNGKMFLVGTKFVFCVGR